MTREAAVLSVSNLSKKYCRDLGRSLWYGLGDVARELTLGGGSARAGSLRRGEFWALRDVSFELCAGESLAVVGANGAGKSTLLKILYGLIKPDAGRVRVAGRVGAMIELGTGFNPVLTGRENVRVGAALLGLPRAGADDLIGAVADFAGLEEFMDTPVQFYSSGMQARLSYAVAAHLRPDLLLVDEVLAVGDLAYQRKCFNHMRKYLDEGGTLVFVSHSPYHVQSICRRGILLEGGRLAFDGTAVECLDSHFGTQLRGESGDGANVERRAVVLDEDHPVAVESVAAEATGGGELRTGEEVRVTLRYRALRGTDALWGFSIWTGDQWVCVTGGLDTTPRRLAAGAGELRCRIPRLPLAAGSYWLKAAVIDPDTFQPLALLGWRDTPQPFDVAEDPTALKNTRTMVNQLTVLEVLWD
ncbi:MAG: ATP-binding cassette domain-containing protein [Acidobacteria bacterium]|nr:ATP-binding cassette domain-containing protein [Acidobacteriota bacterium]MCA1618408.1 ATP-binding cassette domain-containing protein [Acidobacteriota bacterium]